MNQRLPVQAQMCATCPFNPEGPNTHLAAYLAEQAVTERSRICHSTGTNNAFHVDTGLPPRLCRGARDVQLSVFFGLGFIAAKTDEAWEAKCEEMGL